MHIFISGTMESSVHFIAVGVIVASAGSVINIIYINNSEQWHAFNSNNNEMENSVHCKLV